MPARPLTREYEIKAAFIYNFMRYIEWPTPRTGYTVGILGDDPFEGFLDQFQSKPLSGKNIVVRAVKTAKDAKGCDVLFIPTSEMSHLDSVLGTLKGAPILTISDGNGFVDKGGQIGFFTERNRIRFMVNTEALQEADLKASSNLLKLAIVRGS